MAKLKHFTYEYFYQKYSCEGLSADKIASELNVSGSSVVRKMRRLGFDLDLRNPIKLNCSYCRKEILRNKSSISKINHYYCNRKCCDEHKKVLLTGENNHFYGLKHSEVSKLKISSVHTGKVMTFAARTKISKSLCGSQSPNWIDGRAERNKNDRMRIEYRVWRIKVFERDYYTCQCCEKKGGKLQAHHIKNYSEFKELRFEINNGITLCKQCHIEFHRLYGKRNNSGSQVYDFIESFEATK